MKNIIVKTALAVGVISSRVLAATFTFTPSPSDLGDLDHHSATTWGISWNAIPAGQVITGAKLTINHLWDWQVEQDYLYIHLLDDPRTGVHTYTDNAQDNAGNGDYFSGQGLYLTTWSDPNGGNNGANAVNFVYNFSASQLLTLTSYITDPKNWIWTGSGWEMSSNFGFGFDPDCHYYNDGVTFEITTGPSNTPPVVPDGGSTLALLAGGVSGLVALRRKFRA